MFTAFYSFRLISFTFLGYPNSSRKNYNNVHEADIYVIIPLVFLSLFSIFFGYFASDLYIGLGYILSKILDRGVFEFCGPFGISLLLSSISNKLSKLDNSLITTYVTDIIISLFVLLFISYLISF